MTDLEFLRTLPPGATFVRDATTGWERVVTFAGAVAGHVAAGCPVLSAEETEARLAICHACDQWDNGKCRMCGCTMMSLKASWADQQCPLGKWPV